MTNPKLYNQANSKEQSFQSTPASVIAESRALLEQIIAKWRSDAHRLIAMSCFTTGDHVRSCADELEALLPALSLTESRLQQELARELKAHCDTIDRAERAESRLGQMESTLRGIVSEATSSRPLSIGGMDTHRDVRLSQDQLARFRTLLSPSSPVGTQD